MDYGIRRIEVYVPNTSEACTHLKIKPLLYYTSKQIYLDTASKHDSHEISPDEVEI